MNAADPVAAVARVLHADGTTAGSSFLVSASGLVATCAHVVAAAGAGPGGSVRLAFQLAGTPLVPATVLAEGWRDPNAVDVAFLQLDEPVTGAGGARPAVPLELRPAAGSAGNRFLAYGYPPTMGDAGMFGYGVVGDVVRAAGRPDLLQLTQTTETTPGFSGGPVIDQVTGGVIGMITSIVAPDAYGRLTQTAFATPAEVLAGLHPALQVSAVCPYRSLDVFEMEHARFFRGRDGVVTDLLARLRVQPRFLAILGPSGSGKSSLLRAGLLSRLREDGLPGSARWRLELCRPSDHGRLLDVLASLATPPTGLGERGARTVVAVDQFEEIFALDGPVRDQVAVAVLGALSGPAPVSVVLTMRDDFFSRLARDLPELMNEWLLPNALNVPASLPEEAVRDIVTLPAQAVGLRVDDDLVDAVLADLPRASDGRGVPSSLLPVIESALTQLWHERDDSRLTTASLRRLGGVSGSLARAADDAYYTLPPEHRLAARQILTRLVHLGDERLEVPDTRQVALLEDLQAGPEDPLVEDVLSRLVAARLVVARRDQANGTVAVELIHDALLREWGLLRQWLSEDRAFFAWRQWLDYRIGDWREDPAATGRAATAGTTAEDGADLLRGRDLAQASQWLTERGDELAPRQRSFIGASLAEQRRRQEEAEAAAAERERAAVLDVTQRLTVQAADVGRLLPVAPARALAAALAATGANMRDLGGEPLAPVQNGLHLAVRTALERLVLTGQEQRVTCCAVSDDGLLLAGGGEDRTVRLWAFGRSGGPVGLTHDDAVTCVTFLPGSRPVIVTGSADGAVRAWTADGRRLPWPRGDHEDAVTGLAVGRGGTGVVSASADGTLRLRDASGNPVGRLLPASPAGVAAIAASPDGSRLVTAGLDGAVRLWDLDQAAVGSATEPRLLAELDAVVPVVAVHPDGVLVAFGDEEGQVHLRRTDGSAPSSAATWSGHGDLVTGLAFSPDGTLLVSAALDGRVLVRDVHSGARVRAPVPAPGGRVLGLAVDGAGRRLVGACGSALVVWDWLPPSAPFLVGPAGGGPDRDLPAEDLPGEQERDIRSRTRYPIVLWDRAGDQQGPAWTGHRDTVYGVAVTVDGHVASAGGDRAVLVRDGGGRVVGAVRAGHDASITAVAASPVDPVVATAGRDGVVRLWTTGGRSAGGDLRGHALDVMAVAFSPDGRLLLTGSRDRTARLWHVAGGSPVPPLAGHEDDVVAVAFHPSGELLVTGSRDETVRLWTLAGGLAAPPLEGHAGFVAAVAVSPDGDAIASAGEDGTVRLWRLDGSAAARPFVAHSGPVHAVRFADGGRLIVTAGDDGTVGVWDRSGGAICEPMWGHEGPVWSLAVTPDGGLAVTGGADTTVRLWRLGTWRDWLREGCERLRQHPLLVTPGNPTASAAADACATGGAGDPPPGPAGRRE